MALEGLFMFAGHLSVSETDEHAKGLVEAIQHVCVDFSPSSACQSIECEHRQFAMIQCGSGYHLVLVVKDADPLLKLHDVLRHCFATFKLIHGPIENIIALDDGVRQLRDAVQRYLNCYGPCVDLNCSGIDLTREGVAYLSVDRLIYCALQSLMNRTEQDARHTGGEFLCVMYAKRVIWSGAADADTTLLFFLLEQDQFKALKIEYCSGANTVSSESKRRMSHFVLSCDLKNPLIGAKDSGRRGIVMIHHNQFCAYFSVDESMMVAARSVLLSMNLLPEVDDGLSNADAPNFRNLADTVRFLYMNGVNLAMKSSLTANSIDGKWSKQCFDVIRRMQRTFKEEDAPLEIVIQSACSRWVVGKRLVHTDRTYFIIVNETLSDVDLVECEISKLENTTFASICLI